MEINSIRILFPLLTIYLFVSGCASTSAPSTWLPTAEQTQTQAYGGWIDVEHTLGATQVSSTSTRGELIALSVDTVYVLDKTLKAIPKSEIIKARLVTYDSKARYLGLWTLAGTLSTISHGFFLILSAPTWIISGSIAATIQSRTPILDYPKNTWDRFESYARFPQGLPTSLSRTNLKHKKIE